MESTSVHFDVERQGRNAFIHKFIGMGSVVDSFVINRGHPGGAELHSVTDTAIIIIHNLETNKLITELIARPEQLRRLYRSAGKEPPRKILKLAYKHNIERYNER